MAVIALGPEVGRAVSAVERALSSSWAAAGGIERVRENAGDDPRRVRAVLRRWCGGREADVVLTVGRAGHRPDDFAPELTAAVVERRLPGVEERMCLAPPSGVEDLLFRGVAGFRGSTLVVNLPGRPARAAAIVRMLAPVVGHALGKARGDATECARGGVAR